MTAPQLPARAVADARTTWVIAGSLMIASVLVAVILPSATRSIFGSYLVSAVLFSAALLLFAIGIRGSGSITARKPLGTIALGVLAVWLLADASLNDVMYSADLPDGVSTLFGWGDALVQFVAALIAVVQIARAGTLPHPWNWAPTWALAALTAVWVVSRVVSIGASEGSIDMILLVLNFESLVRSAAPVFLGVMAIVLANRPRRPQTVPVYTTTTGPSESV